MNDMRRLCLLIGALAALPDYASAQVRASELASVSQTIDGTKITVVYSRPRARGRPRVFGDTSAVPWNEVWTPGANWATTLEASKPIKLNGHPVKAGKYSVWMVVRATGDWTVVLDSVPLRWHVNRPDTTKVAVRFPVHVQTVPFTEVLTWSLPDLRASGGTLVMQWGTTKVALDVGVEPSINASTPPAVGKAYVGRYSYALPGKTQARAFTITMDKDTLKGEWDHTDVGDGFQSEVEYMGKFALLQINPDWFVPGLYDKQGDIYEVIKPGMIFEFQRENDRIKGFEIRNGRDMVRGTATRTN